MDNSYSKAFKITLGALLIFAVLGCDSKKDADLNETLIKVASLAAIENKDTKSNVNDWSHFNRIFPGINFKETKSNDLKAYPIARYFNLGDYKISVKGARAGIMESELSIYYPSDGEKIWYLINSNAFKVSKSMCSISENPLFIERYYIFNFDGLKSINAKYISSSGSGGVTETLQFGNNIKFPDATSSDSNWTFTCKSNLNNENRPTQDTSTANTQNNSDDQIIEPQSIEIKEIDASQTGRIKGVAEIKGIQIGMTLEEVKKHISSDSGCKEMPIKIDSKFYEVADYILECSNFIYLKQNSRLEAYFVDNKLKAVTLGTFDSESINKDEYAYLPRVLMESKYGTPPKITDILDPKYDLNHRGKYVYEWEDVQGNKLMFFTSYLRYMTKKMTGTTGVLDGCIFMGGYLKLFSSDFDVYREVRYQYQQKVLTNDAIRRENQRRSDI